MKKIIAIFAFAAVAFVLPSSAQAAECVDVDTSKGALTAAVEASKNDNITGEVDATGCDIGVYVPDGVRNVDISAEVHDADQYGIFSNGKNTRVSDSEVYNIGNHTGEVYDPNGSQTGIGIYFYDAKGAIWDSHIHDYQKGGIAVNGNSKANVHDNVVGGFDPVPFIAQNGIQFGYGARGEIIRNEVTGNWYEGAGWTSTGILVFEANKIKVVRNTVEGSQTGIGIEAWCWVEPSANKNTVANNTVIGADWGITVAAYSLGGYSTCDAKANNNRIVNNTIMSEDGMEGIFLGTGAYYGGTDSPVAKKNDVIHNDISGFDTPISQSGDMGSRVHANVTE